MKHIHLFFFFLLDSPFPFSVVSGTKDTRFLRSDNSRFLLFLYFSIPTLDNRTDLGSGVIYSIMVGSFLADPSVLSPICI